MHDRTQGANPGAVPDNGGKTILLVEDDEVVRMLTLEVLSELDYQVLEAEDAPQALAILRSDQPLDLLMTDIGLPSMSGRELMDIARQLRPHLLGLFASGYGEAAGGSGMGIATITKPYSLELLKNTLQSLLAQR